MHAFVMVMVMLTAHARQWKQRCLHRGAKRWRPRGVSLEDETVLFQTEASYTLCPFPDAFLRSLSRWSRHRGNPDKPDTASDPSVAGEKARHARELQPLQHGGVAVCLEPAAACEIAWSLGLPAVMVISSRLEKGREQPARWTRFVDSLREAVAEQQVGSRVTICIKLIRGWLLIFAQLLCRPWLSPPQSMTLHTPTTSLAYAPWSPEPFLHRLLASHLTQPLPSGWCTVTSFSGPMTRFQGLFTICFEGGGWR